MGTLGGNLSSILIERNSRPGGGGANAANRTFFRRINKKHPFRSLPKLKIHSQFTWERSTK